MSKQIFCRKYQKEMDALDFAPFPGAKGQEYLETVSKQAWQPDAKKFLEEQREKFFSNDDSVEKAEGWTEQK